MLSSQHIARVEEARQVAGFVSLASEVVPLSGGVMTYTAPGSWSNRAMGLGLDGPVKSKDLDSFVAFFEERGTDPRIDISPYADDSLRNGLNERGFRLVHVENTLVHDMQSLPEVPPGDFEVAPPEQWVNASIEGFHGTQVVPEHEWLLARKIAVHDRTTCEVVRVDGEIAGSCVAEIYDYEGERMGALFGGSTLAPYRRQGLQQAMIARRLTVLAEQGAAWVTLGSTPGGPTERNATRLGFRMGYARFVMGKG